MKTIAISSRKAAPLLYAHVTPYGTFRLDMRIPWPTYIVIRREITLLKVANVR
jgi:hypothetical protein